MHSFMHAPRKHFLLVNCMTGAGLCAVIIIRNKMDALPLRRGMGKGIERAHEQMK